MPENLLILMREISMTQLNNQEYEASKILLLKIANKIYSKRKKQIDIKNKISIFLFKIKLSIFDNVQILWLFIKFCKIKYDKNKIKTEQKT